MANLKLIAIDLSDKKEKLSIEDFKLKNEDVKHRLNAAKSTLDDAFKQKMFDAYWREYDPLKQEKQIVGKITGGKITNAWIKCHEMLCWLDKQNLFTKNKILHFDNAAFPGAFIMAAHHFFNTKKRNIQYDWKASSLIEANSEDKEPLEDTYKLYAKYRDHWLMDDKNNGDVTKVENLKDWEAKLSRSVDLYTSDLGFDVSDNYNDQEKAQSRANFAQILAGLLTLKPGGILITKQYTVFEDNTISMLSHLQTAFEKLYICKPASSRQANSEIYIIGVGFVVDEKLNSVIDMFYSAVAGAEFPFELSEYTAFNLRDALVIFENQIEKINHDRKKVLQILNSGYRGKPALNTNITEYRASIENAVYDWYSFNGFLSIKNKHVL